MNKLNAIQMFVMLSLVVSCNSKDEDPILTPDPVYEVCCGSSPVEYTEENTGMYVFVPNVFAPNGDGNNDYFLPIVNSKVMEVVDYTIFAADIDSVIFYRSTIVYGDTEKDFAWSGMRPDGSVYKGPFRYFMKVLSADGSTLMRVEGKACRIECGPNAQVFQTKEGCVFPSQVNDVGAFDPTLPNKETGCF